MSSSRTRTLVAALTTPVALIATGALVYQASMAAFTAQTDSPASNWSTGAVSLTDDDQGAALFSATNLLPSSQGTKCIVVTANTTHDATVALWARNVSGDLANRVRLTITSGTGGSFNDCTGYASAQTLVANTPLTALKNSATDAYGGWTLTAPATGVSRTYQFAWSLDQGSGSQADLDALAGKSATAAFTWQLSTNAN